MTSVALLSELNLIFWEEFGIKLTPSQTKDLAQFLVTWFGNAVSAMQD